MSGTAVNNGIDINITPPNASVLFDATAGIDTGIGGSAIIPYGILGRNNFNGTTNFTNQGVVGRADGTTSTVGLIIFGDGATATPTSTNVASIINSGTVYGIVNIGNFDVPTYANPGGAWFYTPGPAPLGLPATFTDPTVKAGPGGTVVSPVGGTGTITLTGPVAGAAGVWSLGNATFTNSGLGAINGPVVLYSRKTTTTVDSPSKGFTTYSQAGGTASATIGADVGAVAGGIFTGNAVTVVGGTEADATILSTGRTGNVNLFAGLTNVVAGSFLDKSSGNSVTTTKLISSQPTTGIANLSVNAGGLVKGTASLSAGGSQTATIDGTVGTGVAINTALQVLAPPSSASDVTTTVVDTSLATISFNEVNNVVTPTGGPVVINVNATGLVDGRIAVTSAGDQTVTILGRVGGIKDDSTPVSGNITLVQFSQARTDTTQINKNSPNNFLTENDFQRVYAFPAVGNTNVAVGATGNVHGSITASGAGTIVGTIDGTVGDYLIVGANGLTFTNNANAVGWPEVITNNQTYNGTSAVATTPTLLHQKTTDDNTVLGTGITLTISKTGVINGPVKLTSDGPINVQNDGTIRASAPGAVVAATAGSLTATSAANNFLIRNNLEYTFTPTPAAGVAYAGTFEANYLTTQDTLRQTIGSTVTIKNTSLNSIQGPVTATALGDVSFENSGWAVGPVTLTSNGSSTATTDTKSFDYRSVLLDPADPTKGTNYTAAYKDTNNVVTTTATGGNVTGTYSGLTGVIDTALDTLPVGVSPTLGSNYITQAANKNSTAVIPVGATAYMNIGIGAGVTSIGKITTGTATFAAAAFTPVKNKVTVTSADQSFALFLDGKGLAANPVSGSESLSNRVTVTTTTPSDTVASLDVKGLNLKEFNNTVVPTNAKLTNNQVFVFGAGGATITVSGTLEANATAGAAAATIGAANTVSDTINSQSWTILGTGFPGPSGVAIAGQFGRFVETGYSTEQIDTVTAVGNAASVSITGTGTLAALANAIGLTSATVTVDSTASAGIGSVIIEPLSVDSTSDVKTTRVYGTDPSYPYKYIQTTTSNVASAPSALAGNAQVTTAGTIKTSTVVVSSPTGTATATIKGTPQYQPAAGGTIGGVSKLASVTVLAASGQAGNAYKVVTTSTTVMTGFDLGVDLVNTKGTPLLPSVTPTPPTIGVPYFQVPASPVPDDQVSFVMNKTTTSVGNAATATLTAPAAIASDGTKDYVDDFVKVVGDKSATLTVATGTRIGGLATVWSLPQSFINTSNQTYKNVNTVVHPLNNADMTYVLDTDLRSNEIHWTGGTATLTNGGQIRGGVNIQSAGTKTSTLTNTGMLGALNNLVSQSANLTQALGYIPSSNFVSSIQSDFVQTFTGTNLSDPDHSKMVTVNTYTGVGGTSTATNSGTIVGSLQIGAKTGTVTNTGSLGSYGYGSSIFTPVNPLGPAQTVAATGPGQPAIAGSGTFLQKGFGLGGLVLGQSLQHYTQTINQTPTSSDFTDASTPFTQTITANQSALLIGGIVVGSANSQSAAGGTGGGAGGASGSQSLQPGQFNGVIEAVADEAVASNSVDKFGNPNQIVNLSNNGTALKTTTIVATINLGNSSLTIGGPLGSSSYLGGSASSDPGGANAPGIYAVLAQRNITQAAQTTTKVNLDGTNFVGGAFGPNAVGGFMEVPTLTNDQKQFLYYSPVSGLTNPGLTNTFQPWTSTTNNTTTGMSLVSPAAIVGVANLTRNAGGTTYFVGAGFDDRGTGNTADDYYDIQATNFTIASGGEVQFYNVSQAWGSSYYYYGYYGTKLVNNVPTDIMPYGIKGAVSNSGVFVMGDRQKSGLLPNLTTLLAPQTEFVNGVMFRVDGSFTQTATGTTVINAFPSLIRPYHPVFDGFSAAELLATPAGHVDFDPFTTVNNFFGGGLPLNPHAAGMTINGNLTLAGTIQADMLRDSLYVNGATTPIFTVNGTVTLTSPVVTTTFNSPFVGFTVASVAGASAGQTIVQLVVNRSSYASAGGSVNERAAAGALDGALPGVVQKITDDANGKKVFNTIADFIAVQDLATIMSGLDWQLTAPQASRALKDLSGNGQYGSLMALDHTRDLAGTFEDYFSAATPMDPAGTSWWLTPTYRGADFDGSNSRGAADMRSDQMGILAGAQVRMSPNWGAGAGLGYSHDRATMSDPGHTNINTFMVGGNVHYVGDQFNVGVQLDYGYNTYNADRDLPFLSRVTDASFNGHELRGRIEGGWRVPLSGGANGNLLPYLALDIIDREIHGFTESGLGGGVALQVDSHSDTEFDPKLGVRWNGSGWNTGMFVLAPLLDLAYTFSDPGTSSDLGFVAGTTTFHTLGVNPGGFVSLQGGLFGAIGSAGSLGIKAGGDFGSNRTGAMGSLVFRMQL